MDIFCNSNNDFQETTSGTRQSTSVDEMGNVVQCVPISKEGNNSEERYKKMEKNDEKFDDKTATAIIDSQLKEIQRLEEQLKQSNEQNETLERKVNQLKEERSTLIDDKLKLQQKYCDLRESSRELTEKMANLSSSDPRYENTNDETSPSKLGKLSDQIYNDDWFKAFECLERTGLEEKEILKRLWDIIEMAYKKCRDKSTSPMRQLLLLSEDEELPSFINMHRVYQLRKSVCHDQSKRRVVIEEISKSIIENLESQNTDTEATSPQDLHTPLNHYVSRCTELCWLVATSSPPLVFVLDAVGKEYKDNQTHFSQYSASDSVLCDNEENLGSVALVVWPALISAGDNVVYNKGTVLVYDKIESRV